MSTHDDATPTSPAEPPARTAPSAPTEPTAPSTPSAPTTPNNADHLSTQLVVLGAGGSGIAAALAAAERGVEVILLEKGNKPGGAAMFGATGFAAYGSPAQREAGETFGPREAYRAITAYTRHRCNAPLVSAVVGRSGDTAAWLEGHGLRTQLVEHGEAAQDPTVTTPTPHDDADPLTAHRAARTYHRYVSKFGGFKKLLKAFEGFGGRLLTETAATALLTGPDGAVRGVRAEAADGRTLQIEAGGVVIATGGFVGSRELVQEELGRIPADELHFTGERKSVGTGRELARAAGGQHLAARALDVPSFTVPGRYSSKALAILANLPLLWVDDAARRFADESVTYRFGQRGAAVLERGGRFWMLLDADTARRLAEEGLDLPPAEDHGAPLPPAAARAGTGDESDAGEAPATPAQPQLHETLQEAIEAGAAFTGETLEELARAVGFPPEQLTRTVEAYNRAVETGVDEHLFTPAEVLRHPVRTGPFSAVKVVTTVRGTLGGLEIDERARLLRPDGAPVPGVFAAGNEATGFFGGSYPQIDGLTLAFAFNSGRIAGESAAEYLGR